MFSSNHSSTILSQSRLPDRVRHALRTRHDRYRTEEAYIHWIKRYIYFHHKRRPKEMGKREISRVFNCLMPLSGNIRLLANSGDGIGFFQRPIYRQTLVAASAAGITSMNRQFNEP